MTTTERAYLDHPITDRAAASAAAAQAAAYWGLPEPTLLRVGMNAIFSCDDQVLRVGLPNSPATASLELADFLTDVGLRVPVPSRRDVVEMGDHAVTCWERLHGCADPTDWASVGSMVRSLHSIAPAELPSGVPLPAPDALPWWDFDTMLERADPLLDAAARAGLVAAVTRHRGWQELSPSVVCHGDVHPGNVMMTSPGVVLLDWDLLCSAPPGWDHAPLLTWASRWGGNPSAYASFASGYGTALTEDPAARSFAELRLVAATLMRLIAGLRDPDARHEAERRLEYWRGDPSAPQWSAQ